MLTVKEIEEWRLARGLSCKQLAERLGANYYHLASVLRGERPLTSRMQRAVEEVMKAEGQGLKVAIAPEYEELLRTWARTAGLSVEDLVQELLAEALRMKRPKAGGFTLPRDEGLMAADDSAPE
jgi:transcriptional regulator with XRE-family HTH domain